MQRSVTNRECINDARSFANKLNESNYTNHLAVPYPTIARNSDTFLSALSDFKGIKKVCHIKYSYMEDGKLCHLPGIVFYKIVSTDPRWLLHDLNKERPVPMCVCCSNAKQVPQFHTSNDPVCIQCDQFEKLAKNVRELVGVVPDPRRCDGPQVLTAKQLKDRHTRVRKGGGKKKGPVAKEKKGPQFEKFPCRRITCSKVYANYATANRHFVKDHNNNDKDPHANILLYTDEEVKAQKKERAAAKKTWKLEEAKARELKEALKIKAQSQETTEAKKAPEGTEGTAEGAQKTKGTPEAEAKRMNQAADKKVPHKEPQRKQETGEAAEKKSTARVENEVRFECVALTSVWR